MALDAPGRAAEVTVFSRASARAVGISPIQLCGPGFTKLFYDSYVRSDLKVTPLLRARAALEVLPSGSRISHHTAVQLWGGVAPESPAVHVSSTSRTARCRRQGIVAHLVDPGVTTTILRGICISTPTQAFLELASAGVSLLDLVVAGDSLVKATRTPPVAFVEAAGSWRGNHGRIAREAARLIREGVDSPMETRLRLLIVWSGLPEPRVNLILRDADGIWQWRFDLAYEECKLIVEYDGRQHAYDDKQWAHDLERREVLDGLGWRVIVVRGADMYADPERVVDRLRAALAERGVTGLPKRLPPRWSRFFAPKG